MGARSCSKMLASSYRLPGLESVYEELVARSAARPLEVGGQEWGVGLRHLH